jgi:SecD/SecF fusion protein
MAEANKKLKSVLATSDTLQDNEISIDSNIVDADIDTNKTEEKSLLDIIEKDTIEKTDIAEADQTYDEYAKENPLFAYLRPALVQDDKGSYYPNKGCVVGYALIRDSARINSMLRKIMSIFPRNLKLAWTVKPFDDEATSLQLIALKASGRDRKAALEGDVIVDARQDFSQNGSNEITMSMNPEGSKKWKRITADNIGKSIAIVLDNYVYTFPTVNGEIPNGTSSITGDFSLEEAKDLANILKAGKLPAPARIVEEAVVGPSLGKEAISAGLISFILAFLLVLIYMFVYYNRAGLVADIVLVTNIFLEPQYDLAQNRSMFYFGAKFLF